MSTLIPIQYHNRRYPYDIKPRIIEVAGNFDSKRISVNSEYSLHTEYSFTSRKFNTDIVKKYNQICSANKKGIQILWYSKRWAEEFADFIKDITDGNVAPHIIEIHPPFSDYTNLAEFMDNYAIFKERIDTYFPNTIVLVENRCGTRYSGGNFIISTIDQLLEFSNKIDYLYSSLKITIDLPQLFTVHCLNINKNIIDEIFKKLKIIRHNIKGIHIWGKKQNAKGKRVAHIGDLNSYFMHDMNMKKYFLEILFYTFNDGVERYFVPEVNSGTEDLFSIVNDLLQVGFRFI